MRGRFAARMLAAVLVLATAGRAATTPPYDLARQRTPGEETVYYHHNQTEIVVTAAERRRHVVLVQKILRRELVLEKLPEAKGTRVAVFTSGAEELVKQEENGKDLLAAVPEERRQRPILPVLLIQERHPKGIPQAPPTDVTDPMAALSALHVHLGVLPEESVKPGDTWSKTHDLGAAAVTVTTTFVETTTVDEVACAVLESKVDMTFKTGTPVSVSVPKATLRAVEAIDGSGLREARLEIVLEEKGESVTRRTTRLLETKLVGTSRLSDESFEDARKQLAAIQQVWELAEQEKLQEALGVLRTLLRDRPKSPWTPAIQALYSSLNQRRLMTQPTSPMELRQLLKQLQVQQDRTAVLGTPQELAGLRARIRQVVEANFETLLRESRDPDPIVRDLAAFGLSFADRPEAWNRLVELAKDGSGRVRGTALVGLSFHGKPIDPNLLVERLKDSDPRTRGGAAMVAASALGDDPDTARRILPLLLDNLTNENMWARKNTAVAVGRLAPVGSRDAARALVEACKTEKVDGLKAVYLEVLEKITGIEGDSVEPFEEWLKKPVEPMG